MPILVTCNCGRTLRARDDQAGRDCRCPACGSQLQVPYPVAKEINPPPAAERSQHTQQPASALTAALNVHRNLTQAPPPLTKSPAANSPTLSDVQQKEKTWRGHIFWLLLFAFLPLAFVIFTPSTVQPQIEQIIEDHPALKHAKVRGPGEAFDKILSYVPGHRLPGALFSRDTYAHYFLAALAAALFASIIPFAIPADEDEVSPASLFGAGLFTATIGIALLLTFQFFHLCFCLIGIWYVAAEDPRAPFGPSLLGFTLGVGVAEEITKVIPVLWRIHKDDITWRGACLVGMASGAGFGIAEGVHYCATFYNGIYPLNEYVVRFLSDVSFHIMLSGAAAMMLFHRRKHLGEWIHIYDWVLTLTAIMIVPIFLHGLFDTLLKKDFAGIALIVWLATFAWLAWLINNGRQKEIKAAMKNVQARAKVIRTEHGTRYIGT